MPIIDVDAACPRRALAENNNASTTPTRIDGYVAAFSRDYDAACA